MELTDLQIIIPKIIHLSILAALAFSLSLLQYINIVYAQSSSGILWYVGKGLKQNMYMKYQIQYNGTNDNQPFNMTLYFKEYNQTKNYWIALMSVDYDNNKHMDSTIYLSDTTLDQANTSYLSQPLKNFLTAYYFTIDRLVQYVPKGTVQTLNDTDWGRVAINCCHTLLHKDISVTVPAGTFDTTLVTEAGGQPKSWIDKDLPYPVKGEYLDTGISPPNTIFSFELLSYGYGMPLQQPLTASVPEFPSGSYIMYYILATTTAMSLYATKYLKNVKV